MRTYIRSHSKCGTYFFTVNLAQRKQNDLLVRHVDNLRPAFRYTKQRHPLVIEAIVILPEHLHCIWRLPEGDDDYPLRWRLIKSHFSRHIEKGEIVSASRLRKNERGIYPMGTSGNAAIGSTKSVTIRIFSGIWIIFITIL